MKTHLRLLTALTFFTLTGLASAQTASPTPADKPVALNGFWRAVLPAGVFRVRLDKIESVSTHEYTIEPITRVTEMNVETSGSLVTRFYYMEFITPQTPMGVGQSAVDMIKSKTQEVAEKVAGDMAPWRKVSKVYPATTHAHTVEYRVQSKADLDRLMSSIEKAWSTNQGEQITVN